MMVRQSKLKKKDWTAVNASCHRNLSTYHRFTSPALGN